MEKSRSNCYDNSRSFGLFYVNAMPGNNVLISIVSPVYQGEKMVRELVRRVSDSVSAITNSFEIILVNDGSPDDSWREIEEACSIDKRVKGISLSRNFGQQYAITAGLHYAQGDWVVVMDCDLQDRPEEIPNLYNKAMEGWDIVYAIRMNKQFGFWKKMSSIVFHKVFDWMSGMKTDSSRGSFGIYRKNIIAEYNSLGEVARSFDSLIALLGFKSTSIEVQHGARIEGKSSYNLVKLLKLSFDIIISNSNKPLRMAVACGFVMASVSFLFALYNIIAKWIGFITISGYTTTIFSIWFVGGMLVMIMGVIGLYVGKIFNQVKGRPIYVVSEKINIE